MNKPYITIFERNVLLGALPDLLAFDVKPYPFYELTKFFTKHKYNPNVTAMEQKLSFYQSIKDRDSLSYSDVKEKVIMID